MEGASFPVSDQFANAVFGNNTIPFEESMTAFTESGMIAEGTLQFNPSTKSCIIVDFSMKKDGTTEEDKTKLEEATCMVNHLDLEKKRGVVKSTDGFLSSLWGSAKQSLESRRHESDEPIYYNSFAENNFSGNEEILPTKEGNSYENSSVAAKTVLDSDENNGNGKSYEISSQDLIRDRANNSKNLSQNSGGSYQASEKWQPKNLKNINESIDKHLKEHVTAFKENNVSEKFLNTSNKSSSLHKQQESQKENSKDSVMNDSKQSVRLPSDGMDTYNSFLKENKRTESSQETNVDDARMDKSDTHLKYDQLEGKVNIECQENWDLKKMMDPFDEKYPDLHTEESLYENIQLQGGITRTTQMFDALRSFADDNGLEIKDCSPRGNCMFLSIDDQLRINGDFRYDAHSLRNLSVKYLEEHPTNPEGTHLECFTDEPWNTYLQRMAQPYEWGDHLVLQALCEALQRNIITITVQSDDISSHHEFVPKYKDSIRNETLYLGHLGEFHYVSLRLKGWKKTWVSAVLRNGGKEEKGIDSKHRETLDIDSLDVDPISRIPVPHLSFAITQITSRSEICYFFIPNKLVPVRETDSICTTGGHSDGSEVLIMHKDKVKQCEEFSKMFSHEKPLAILYQRETDVICDGKDTPLQSGQIRAEAGRSHPGYCNLCYFGEVQMLLTANRVRINENIDEKDTIVRGYRCPNWPFIANEWLTRNSDWPSKDMRKEIANLGCMIAKKSHQHSALPEYEWQFIFNDAENILVNQCLTEYQLYVYGLFKACLDFHTRSLNAQLGTTHIKSTFFYVCEKVNKDTFENSPGACFIYLADALLRNLRERKVPNYFIRENNMVDHFEEKDMGDLTEVVDVIRCYPLQCLDIMMEERGYSRSETIHIIERSEEYYSKDRDPNAAFRMMFFPWMIRESRKHALNKQYRKALEKILDAHQLLVLAPIPGDGKRLFIPSLENILTQTLETFDGTTKFMMKKELRNIMENIGMGSRKVKDLTHGIDVAGTGEMPIPSYVECNPLEEAFFLSRFGIIQHFAFQNYENASIFYTAAIDLLRNATAELELSNESEQMGYRQTDNTCMSRVAEYDSQAMWCFKNLLKLRKSEKLKPRMTHLEEICKRMRKAENVDFVMEAWDRIGDTSSGANFYTSFLKHTGN
ncbi:hypothetical protein FSP39_010673 [Pinctada imbricata]|uniref:OTU domain-containing protein n=1 Tax=Pinctada imbricata TaxID=66713 RepID=A0AA89CAF6_PINIB|nr:hypothetical protein FSP39_010673 [Pinctada imbricata]